MKRQLSSTKKNFAFTRKSVVTESFQFDAARRLTNPLSHVKIMRVILIFEVIILAEYETRQRKVLLGYLEQHPDRGFSIEELYEALASCYPPDQVPGKSTLYRLVPKLISEGLVKRFSGEHGRQFQYQLVPCKNCEAHLHLKCTSCGNLLHLDHAASEQIMDEVLEQSAFSLNQRDTILFGVCKNCKKGKE